MTFGVGVEAGPLDICANACRIAAVFGGAADSGTLAGAAPLELGSSCATFGSRRGCQYLFS